MGTYNRGAMRILLTACRRDPELFPRLLENLAGGKISETFIREWEYCLKVGLPSQTVHLTPIEHQAVLDMTANTHSTLVNQIKTMTGTVDSPTYGTVSEDLLDGSSTHRYTSAS